ncbi:MAG: NAD-dependent epimerase/dehydratase family protein [Bacteriovoracaceae bacterium]|nr:NAD-dependent epimerase/dehydratase family protein [Bacteriovoracaceae bacterium]
MDFDKSKLVNKDFKELFNHYSENSLLGLRDSKIFISGGTGFVGTWISELVSFLNDEFKFGIKLSLLSRNVEKFKQISPHLFKRKDIELISGDVRHIFEVPSDTNFIIHAAAIPDSRFHANSPLETMSIIADGTKNILNLSTRLGDLRTFLNISSAYVYGYMPPELSKFPENYNGSIPSYAMSSAYAEAKRYAETMCASATSQLRIPIINARPFSFIGAYQSINSPWAINNFIRDAINGYPIRILGDGETIRSYMYGADMAFWFFTILCRGVVGQSYNVGSPNAISLNQLAKKISSYFNNKSEIQLSVGGSGGEKVHKSKLVPDTSFAENSLGLRHVFNLDLALEQSVLWYSKA